MENWEWDLSFTNIRVSPWWHLWENVCAYERRLRAHVMILFEWWNVTETVADGAHKSSFCVSVSQQIWLTKAHTHTRITARRIFTSEHMLKIYRTVNTTQIFVAKKSQKSAKAENFKYNVMASRIHSSRYVWAIRTTQQQDWILSLAIEKLKRTKKKIKIFFCTTWPNVAFLSMILYSLFSIFQFIFRWFSRLRCEYSLRVYTVCVPVRVSVHTTHAICRLANLLIFTFKSKRKTQSCSVRAIRMLI